MEIINFPKNRENDHMATIHLLRVQVPQLGKNMLYGKIKVLLHVFLKQYKGIKGLIK